MTQSGPLSYEDLTYERVMQLIASEHPLIRRYDSGLEDFPILPEGEPVIIDGFAFLNFARSLKMGNLDVGPASPSAPMPPPPDFLYGQGVDGQSANSGQDYPWPPADIQKLEQITRVIRKIEKKTGERISRFIRIDRMPSGEGDLGFAMSKNGLLEIGYGELSNPTPDDELDAVLLHELAHYLHSDGKLPLGEIYTGLMPEYRDYRFSHYLQNPDEKIDILSRETPGYIAQELGSIRLNNEVYREYVTRLHEYLAGSRHFAARAESILYDMETGGDALRQHFAGIPDDILQKAKNNPGYESVQDMEAITGPEAIKAFLDEEVSKNAAVQPKALEILAVIEAIKHAQESRADRYAARHADNPVALANYLEKSVPAEWRDGTGSHPSVMERAGQVMNAGSGRMMDEWAACGGFADELRQPAIDHVTALRGNNRPALPVRVPETLTGQVRYGKWTNSVCSSSNDKRSPGK